MVDKKEIIEKLLDREEGILRLNAAWVARDFLPPGKRLGLKEEEYDVGARIPYHIHQMEKDARLVGRNSKDKAYYFLDDVDPEQRKNYGERIILNQIDWETCGDPYFYENHHLKPLLIEETEQEGGEEYWIYYNTSKFSGKKVVVKPGQTFQSRDNGVYSIFVWKGGGAVGGDKIEPGNHTLDELLVSHETSVKPLAIQNTGPEELMLIKFFGPDINKDVPMIKKRG